MFAKFNQFLPVPSHFDTKRPVNFFHIATFPSPTFGPLFAFHCPLFFTKNNNLECRDVLKTVTVTSDQKRFGEKQAIRRRQFAAIDCDVFMCGSYRNAGSELPQGLGAYVRVLY